MRPLFLSLIILTSCSGPSQPKKHQSGEYVYRRSDERLAVPDAVLRPPPLYPWEEKSRQPHPKITKEFFRCRGSGLNPLLTHAAEGHDDEFYFDCSGGARHSLPMRDGKEEIYPVLIDLLNYVQDETGHRVIITAGHRCPAHNTYANPDRINQTSKHQIGAEVTFYVEGYEETPQEIIDLLQKFYLSDCRDSFRLFHRWEKGSNVAISPWYNKEIFIKLYGSNEGRDFDNDHPYPYIAIQIKYDRDRDRRVIYTWQEAQRGYCRSP